MHLTNVPAGNDRYRMVMQTPKMACAENFSALFLSQLLSRYDKTNG